MNRLPGILTLAALCGACAMAQEAPLEDAFIGYSFLRVNSAQQIPAFTANGGVATLAWNLNNHLGVELEFGGYHNGNVNHLPFDTTSFSYLLGPRVSWGRTKKIDPYLHVLVGANWAISSIAKSALLTPTSRVVVAPSGRYEDSQASFAMAAGGGLDIQINKYVLFRPVQIDYYLTDFNTPNLFPAPGQPPVTTSNKIQNNLRYAAGIVFTFTVQ